MADLSKLSNDELIAIASGKSEAPKQAAPINSSGRVDMAKLSNEELMKIAAGSPESSNAEANKIQSVQDSIMKPIAAVGSFVDKYTGAPTRAAIGAIQDGNNPLSAFGKQFGDNPDLAPTGKDIATKAGFSTDQKYVAPFKDFSGKNITASPAGLAGFVVDVAADPTNLVPGTTILKTGGKMAFKGAVEGTSLAAKGLAKGTDLITGTRFAGKTYESAANTANAIKQATSSIFNPKIAKDFEEMTQIATKNGISKELLPSSVEFGPNSIISRSDRVKAEGFSGEGLLDKHEQGLSAVRDATQRQIQNISGGPVLSKQEAGAYIRGAYDESVDAFFSKVGMTHNQIIKDYPGLKLSTGLASQDEHLVKLDKALDEIRSFAEVRVDQGVTELQEKQGRRLIKSVDAIKNSSGSYKDTVEALRNIGEAAFKSQNTLASIPADVEKMRKIYFALDEALIESIRKNVQNGNEVANELWFSNKEMSNFISDKNPLAKVIGNKNFSDEAVFRTLVENGDSNKLQSLHAVLGEDRMKPIKGAWLDTLLKRDLDQSFNFRPIVGTIRNKRIVMENLLSPDEIKNFTDIVRLGDGFGNPIMSTSGTGASNILNDVKQGVMNSIGNDAFIDRLKDRARGITPPSKVEAKTYESGLLGQVQKLKEQGLQLPKRGPREKALKSSQAISVQQRNKEKEADTALQRYLNGMQ